MNSFQVVGWYFHLYEWLRYPTVFLLASIRLEKGLLVNFELPRPCCTYQNEIDDQHDERYHQPERSLFVSELRPSKGPGSSSTASLPSLSHQLITNARMDPLTCPSSIKSASMIPNGRSLGPPS